MRQSLVSQYPLGTLLLPDIGKFRYFAQKKLKNNYFAEKVDSVTAIKFAQKKRKSGGKIFFIIT